MGQGFEMKGGQVYLDGVKVTQAEVEAGRKALAVQEKPEPCFAVYIPDNGSTKKVISLGWPLDGDWHMPLDVRVSPDKRHCYSQGIRIDPAETLEALEDKRRLDKWERMARHDGRPAFFEIERYGSMRVYEQNFANYRASTIREAIDARREES